jgi:Tol biopolymer transport system component
MLSGRRAFQGDTRVATLSAILHSEPPGLRAIAPGLPREIETIVARCLRKDLDRRIQHMRDLKLALQELLEEGESGSSSAVPLGKASSRRRALIAGLTAGLVIAAIAWFRNTRGDSAPAARTLPVTSYPGIEVQPALSPDGKQVAFVWDGGTPGQFDVYVKLVDAGTPLRLTNHPGLHSGPAWSPDGRYIAFARVSETDGGIFVVPALGGQERKLADVPRSGAPQLAWSRDGKWLAIAGSDMRHGPVGLSSLSVETGQRRTLTAPSARTGLAAESSPAFSPEGRTLAFIRYRGPATGDIFTVAFLPDGTLAGEPKRLTFDERAIAGLDWTPDGRNLVFSSNRDGARHLWRISYMGGLPERLVMGEDVYELSIARHPAGGVSRLVYSRGTFDTNVWRMAASGDSAPVRLIASTQDDYHAQYSPDGKRIAFASKRSGSEEIWVSAADGSNPAQLTFGGGPANRCPRWSPDSRWIAYDSRINGDADIYVIDAAGGSPRRLTYEASDEVRPSWSRDGRRIYFASNRKGGWQIWSAPAEGGSATQVTQKGGREAFESIDGRYLYYAKATQPGIWKAPVGGGEEARVCEHVSFGNWTLGQQGVYVVRTNTAVPEMYFLDFATGRERRIAEFSNQMRWSRYGPNLSLSPDGRWLLYGLPDLVESDIRMVENFR